MYENMYKRLGESQIIQKHGQMSMFDFDTENNVVAEEDVLGRLEAHLDSIEVNTLIERIVASFIIQEGIALPLSTYFSHIRKMENEGRILVTRIPEFDSSGKKRTFMHSSKGNQVYVKRREEKLS